MSATAAPVFAASWLIARLWSRRTIAWKRSRGTSGALLAAISAFVFAGLPTTSTLMSSAACGVDRLALRLEDAAVGLEQVGALHASAARARADEQRDVRAVEGDVRVVGRLDAGEQREGAVVELHDHALDRSQRGRDLEQAQLDRLVGAEQLPAGDAEQQAVADLAGGAGHGDADGCLVSHVVISCMRQIGRRCYNPALPKPPQRNRYP